MDMRREPAAAMTLQAILPPNTVSHGNPARCSPDRAPPFSTRGALSCPANPLPDVLLCFGTKIMDKYLDAGLIYAEEDGSYKGKAEMLKEVQPLPKGLGG